MVEEPRNKTISVRVTTAQFEALKRAAASCPRGDSEWMREALLESLGSSPKERRLMAAVRLSTARILAAIEECRRNNSLDDPDVRARIERTAQAAVGGLM
jgi:hypothetical protein